MLEHLHDRAEASYLVTDLATRIVEEESDVITKLRYIRRTVAYAKDAVAVEDAEQLKLLMLSPDAAKYFIGAQFSLHDGSYLAASAKNTESHLTAVMSYVAASGLVFAHSFLEFVIETLLRMTRFCDAAAWLPLIGTKTIPISTLLDSGIEPAAEAKLNDYVATLRNESLPNKIAILAKLLKRSITSSNVRDYAYDPTRLGGLDILRHRLAHHRKKDYTLDQAEADLVYLYRTAFHFLDLVVHHYDLHGAHRPESSAGA
jgi:hypothetical protein